MFSSNFFATKKSNREKLLPSEKHTDHDQLTCSLVFNNCV